MKVGGAEFNNSVVTFLALLVIWILLRSTKRWTEYTSPFRKIAGFFLLWLGVAISLSLLPLAFEFAFAWLAPARFGTWPWLQIWLGLCAFAGYSGLVESLNQIYREIKATREAAEHCADALKSIDNTLDRMETREVQGRWGDH